MQTIEQILGVLASVDSPEGVKLPFDLSIYPLAAIIRSQDAVERHCSMTISKGPVTMVSLVPKDPRTARASIALALGAILQASLPAPE